MKVEIERLENQQAKITVALEPEYFEQAKRKAATALSARYKIPGFRKGKAPYNVVATMLGEGAIIEEAVERVADEIYPKALKESGLDPYSSGSLEDVKMEPTPTYVFALSLQPEVELSDYKSVRMDFADPTVSEQEIDDALRGARAPEMVDHEGELESGLRVTIDMHTHFVDGDERPESEEDDEDEDEVQAYYKGDEWLHFHDEPVQLNSDTEPYLPGFVDQLIGKKVGDKVEFELTAPTDDEEYEDIAGRVIHFEVTIKKAQREIPVELNDEYAASLTSSEATPLNLEQIRERVRENMLRRKTDEYLNVYATSVIDAITAESTVRYPLKMVEERVEEMVQDLEANMKEQGISLDFYKQVLNLTDEQIRERYQEEAAQFVGRSVVVSEIVKLENLEPSKQDIDAEIERMLVDQPVKDASKLRTFLNRREQRNQVARNLVSRRMMDYFVRLGKGEAESLPSESAASE